MSESKPKKFKESKKDKKRSIIKERVLVVRVLAYILPFKRAIFLAAVFSFLSAFFGAFSVLPLIPVINHVLNPEETRQAEERAERSAAADQRRLEQLSAIGEGAGEDLAARFPIIERTRTWFSLQKDRSRQWIYNFLEERRTSAIKYIALLLVLITIVKAVLEYQTKYQMNKVVFKATRNLKVDLYTGCLDLDFATLQHRTSGNLIARLSSDISKVRTILQTASVQTIIVPFEIIALFSVMLILSVKITLITIFAVPLLLGPIFLLGKKLRSFSKADAEEDAYLVDVMQETLQGMPIVKAYSKEDHERQRFETVSAAQVKRQIRRLRLALAAPAITDVIVMGMIGLVLFAGGYVVLEAEEMTSGEFMVYLFILTRLYKPIKMLTGGFVKMQRGLASAERVFEIIDARPTVVEKPDAIALSPITTGIEFRDIHFSYGETREKVLHDFSLTIPKGRCVALVGMSGSGKTTVTRLVPRFYDPVSGSVKIDGTDLRDVTFKSLRDQVAIVTQETILFDDTIRNNIAYGRADATFQDIEDAARAANAHDFIMSLPDGYDTRIGERGGQLSGGQRQRIAIARALLRDCPILILDEATSALDNESEALVQEALERLMRNRTTLVIAHRLSTVRYADAICVMEKGTIVEQGTHEELLALSGRYADFYQKDLRKASDQLKAAGSDVVPATPSPLPTTS